ncbi:MAG: heme-binding protein [Planctomycetes bacterium]|nr:heme-binding protein [Planctomycetota bacterium]
MQWLDAIRIWLQSEDTEERPYASILRFGTAEVLECRLVLGALEAAPASMASADLDQTPGGDGAASQTQPAVDDSVTATSLESNPSSQPSGTPQDPAPTGTMTTVSDDQAGAVNDTSIPTVLNNTTTDAASDSADDLPSTQPQSVDSTTTPPTVNVLATESTPLAAPGTSSTESPAIVPFMSTPGVSSNPLEAMDTALTAVNRNIFLTPEEIAAGTAHGSIIPAWFGVDATPTTIHYDFRDAGGITNAITAQQMADTEQVLNAWSEASGGRVTFVQDTQADASQIVNIGVGDLTSLNLSTSGGQVLGTSNHLLTTVDGEATSVGTVWLNGAMTWTDASVADPAQGGIDFNTVMAHEFGHMLGMDDNSAESGIMNPLYTGPQDLSGVGAAFASPRFYTAADENPDGSITDQLVFPQLTSTEVSDLLSRAAAALPVNDAIIAVVDRNGTILGVRAEQGVLDTILDPATLAFAIDGAVSEARTAAYFANDLTPVTSRTVQYLAQTTILQREVEANPNSVDPTIQGPGFVAPIGLGGHFPAGIEHTGVVDLFSIEASNRDSTVVPGFDRFNIPDVPGNQGLVTPISYGTAAGIAGDAQNRGIGTLPGGIPIYRDTNGDGIGDKLIGGIGVFFPGPDGYATHEQGFVADVGQTVTQRMNSTQELQAEFMALAAIGGSRQAGQVVGTLGGIAPVAGIDLPFGNLTLNGIQLPVVGTIPGRLGVQNLVNQFRAVAGTGTDAAPNQILAPNGADVPDGWLVTPHTSVDSTLTVADLSQIISDGIAAAERVRATLRLGPDHITGGTGVRMTFCITDSKGSILAMYRMPDSTLFSADVAVAKARNVAYYDDPSQVLAIDQVPVNDGSASTVAAGTSFTSRTFRFLAEPRFPAGVDGSAPPYFSILNDPGINPETGENLGAPTPASDFTSVLGHDAFNPGTNFHAAPSANQNGIIFFPGSTALYKNGVIVGGLGVSGDGVSQDDVVTYLAAQGFLPNGTTVPTADEVFVDGVRLPFIEFNRNPFG